jgi:hypothetical protein
MKKLDSGLELTVRWFNRHGQYKRNKIHYQIQPRNLSMEKARIQIVEDEAIIAMEIENQPRD